MLRYLFFITNKNVLTLLGIEVLRYYLFIEREGNTLANPGFDTLANPGFDTLANPGFDTLASRLTTRKGWSGQYQTNKTPLPFPYG